MNNELRNLNSWLMVYNDSEGYDVDGYDNDNKSDDDNDDVDVNCDNDDDEDNIVIMTYITSLTMMTKTITMIMQFTPITRTFN